MINHESVQAWLDNYIEAWRTYDESTISNLFSEDALYCYHPYDEENPVRGRAAIVASWLEAPNAPDSWEAHYAPVAIEGNVGVAQGRTRYLRPDGTVEREFDNMFALQFDDGGRCTRFTEWYMQRPGV